METNYVIKKIMNERSEQVRNYTLVDRSKKDMRVPYCGKMRVTISKFPYKCSSESELLLLQ
jgi:hypothetical protein